MIIINLLPEELRPIKRTPLPHILSVLALIVALVAMGAMFVNTASQTAEKNAELDTAEQELAGLAAIVEEYNALSEKKQQLENKINVIQEILSDRIIWSEQLHTLASLTPENFWYQRIREKEKTTRAEVVVMDPKTGEPEKDKDGNIKTKTEPKRIPVLEISGYVVNDDQGVNSIYPLTYATTQHEAFSSLFTLDSPQITDSEYNGYKVRGFVLEYKIDNGGAL